MPELTPVQEYYKGKTVFITGASGFMGKVLVEKLLYSCSALKEVIIIVRPKRGKSPEVRLEEMFKLPIFQRIREEKPEVLKKVTSFNGDVTYENLGLSGENLKYVTDNTNIVFHMAATLKLEGNLKDAIDMNTTGTRRALDIAKQMKGLEAFVHVSTAFCNCDQEVMHEKIYEYPHKPEDLMRMVEWMDVKTLESITPELLKPHPNTYTYSKRLAEILVRDHYETMPVIIARPSIVSPSAYEPVPGWVDNLNGPTGLLVGAGKGVIRSMLIDTRFKSEVIPVDYAINGLVVMPYDFNKQETRPATVPIFNITAAEHRKLQWGEAIEMGKKIGYEYPMELCLWYPDGCITTNRLHHQINVILFHWLPAYLIDFLLLILGQKRFMLRVQRRIQIGLEVLQFFSMRSWVFKSTAFDGLWKSLTPEDKKIFNMDMDPKESIQEYMLSCLHGGRLYLMKETPESLPRARRNLKILYVLDRFCKTVIVGLLAYWLYNRIASFISVSPAAFEPQKGWVDNLNGPTGLMIGVGKGVIRSVLVDEKNRSEVIPVDYAINGLIVMPYEFYKSRRRPVEVPVYNITNADHRKTKMGEVIGMCKRLGREYPLNVGLWYPDAVITTNKLYHQFNVLMFHWLPAYFLDFLLLIFGQKRFMVRVQNKISTGLEVLQFFTLHPWYFKSDNFASLWQNLSVEDKAVFNMDMNSDHNEEEYIISCIKGGREYILKEKNEDLPKARFHQKIMYGIDRFCKTVIVGLFVYYLLKWTGVLALFSGKEQ